MQNLLICVGVLRCSGGHCRKLKALAYTFDDGRVFFCLTACSHWPHTQLHQLYPDISTTSAAAAPPSNAAGATFETVFSSLLPLPNALWNGKKARYSSSPAAPNPANDDDSGGNWLAVPHRLSLPQFVFQ